MEIIMRPYGADKFTEDLPNCRYMSDSFTCEDVEIVIEVTAAYDYQDGEFVWTRFDIAETDKEGRCVIPIKREIEAGLITRVTDQFGHTNYNIGRKVPYKMASIEDALMELYPEANLQFVWLKKEENDG